MRRLINDPYQIVEEMLAGYCKAFESKVELIGEMKRVVVSKSAPVKDKVGIIVGGGSGHEPLFLGYVGDGFADAAVGAVLRQHRRADGRAGAFGQIF